MRIKPSSRLKLEGLNAGPSTCTNPREAGFFKALNLWYSSNPYPGGEPGYVLYEVRASQRRRRELLRALRRRLAGPRRAHDGVAHGAGRAGRGRAVARRAWTTAGVAGRQGRTDGGRHDPDRRRRP